MILDISNLIKALGYMNKSTLIPTYDNYIIFENNKIILQDAYKTYTMDLGINLENNFVLAKDDLLKVKSKNSKYYITNISENNITVEIKSKAKEESKIIEVEKRTLNHNKIIYKSFHSDNLISTNGINLKALLSGMKESITLELVEDTIYIYINNNKVSFNECFGDICTLDVISKGNNTVITSGQNIVDALNQFGLTKKDNLCNISFNKNGISLMHNNITIHINSNKQ